MARFVLRRLLLAIPVLVGTTFLIYLAVYALPGDPVRALVGPDQVVTPSLRRALRARYHLDEPLPVQYWHYLRGLATGDLGTSLTGRPVRAIVAAAWPVTWRLGLTAWALNAVLGVLLGALAGFRRGRVLDVGVLAAGTAVMSVPFFVAGYLAQLVLGVRLHWLPVSGTADGWPASYLLPALVLALYTLPQTTRVTRAEVLDTLQAEHVETAVAKGLAPLQVLTRHVLRNSLVPVVSLLGVNLGYLLGGTVLVEGIFNLPGLGFQIFSAVPAHDGPVVVGVGTLLVLVFLVTNLLVDVLYAVLDPRLRPS